MPSEQPKRRGPSFSRKRKSEEIPRPESSSSSEVAIAAAAATASASTSLSTDSKSTSQPEFKQPMPTITVTSSSSSPSRTVRSPSTGSRPSTASNLYDARQTLRDNQIKFQRTSMRSHEMSNSAANFASVAQGLLEMSSKKR